MLAVAASMSELGMPWGTAATRQDLLAENPCFLNMGDRAKAIGHLSIKARMPRIWADKLSMLRPTLSVDVHFLELANIKMPREGASMLDRTI